MLCSNNASLKQITNFFFALLVRSIKSGKSEYLFLVEVLHVTSAIASFCCYIYIYADFLLLTKIWA